MTLTKPKPRALVTVSTLVAGLLLIVLSLLPTANANSGVSQGFMTTSTDLIPGMLLGLQTGSQQYVEPAVAAKQYQLLGVLTDKPLIALSSGSNEVQINISGLALALVSDVNGTIKIGDKVTASPFSGVGMKATDAGQIVGSAQQDFSNIHATSQTVTDNSGKQQTIRVGLLPVQINVGYYAGDQTQSKLAAILPPTVLSFANSIANKQVSPFRVLISLFALALGFIITAGMLQTGIRSSVISVGRNPLAKKALRRELLDVSFTALGVLVLTIVLVFVILRL